MGKRIIQIKLVIIAVLTFVMFNQCGNPYRPMPTELTFAEGEQQGGSLTTADSVTAFENSVYQVTRARCVSCHDSQNPVHASSDVQQAHDIVVNQFKVNFSNVASSRLVLKLRDEAHNCWSDCTENAMEMQLAIQDWADAVDSIEEEIDNQSINDTGSDTVSETGGFIIVPGLSSQAAFDQTVYPITSVRCTTCHINTFPKQANPNKMIAHNDLVNGAKVDFINTLNSRIVQRLSTDEHNCWSNNCASDANEMKSAIDQWNVLMQDTLVPDPNGENNNQNTDALKTSESATVAVVVAEGGVGILESGTGYLEYDLSGILGVNDQVVFRAKIKEFDEFSYQIWDAEILSPTLNVRVRNIKTLINGYYNPQNSAFTIVDTTATPNMSSISPYYLLSLKDQGIGIDKFSFSFQVLEVNN